LRINDQPVLGAANLLRSPSIIHRVRKVNDGFVISQQTHHDDSFLIKLMQTNSIEYRISGYYFARGEQIATAKTFS
jgi:hypothetical protein